MKKNINDYSAPALPQRAYCPQRDAAAGKMPRGLM